MRIHYIAYYRSNAIISSYNEDSIKNTPEWKILPGKTEMPFYIKYSFLFFILGSDLHYRAVAKYCSAVFMIHSQRLPDPQR